MMSRPRILMLVLACSFPLAGVAIQPDKASKMPAIKAPIMFDTPEADAICSALQVFPPDNPWNLVVEDWPVHPNSKNIVASMGANKPLRYDPDMSFILVPPDQKKVNVQITLYPDESDKGPFPVPDNCPIEGWPVFYQRSQKFKTMTLEDVQRDKANLKGDRHAIVVDPVNRLLYEFFVAFKSDAGWRAGQASIFDLKSNKLRPEGWTSADAAGLPIFPAVVRYDEIKRGLVTHAMRVTAEKTRKAYVYPATHHASPHTDENLPRMGERFRLRKDFDIRGFSPAAQAILKGLKKYGMLMADNGNDWAISTSADPRIPEMHDELRKVKGTDFEVIIQPPANQPAKQTDKQKASVWMKAKTEYSRNILSGLTEGDFAKISKNAESLNFASNLEVLYRTDVPGYKQQISLFVAANENLIRQAEDKNLLGAALAFNQLTVSCVQCHQLVRDTKK
jgi:cytochrome c556